MVEELVRDMLAAGVHFGHQTHRWNPKMKPYIFGQRSKIYIIDLEKTAECLNVARDAVRDIAAKGGRVLFVGTKKQAQPIIQEEAQKCEMYHVTHRWLGGLLTNFQTVRKSINRLKEIEQMETGGVWESLTKKEISGLNKERDKLLQDLGGIREMTDIPQVMFIVDPRRESIAVSEAHKLGIPIIAIVDTNCDPEEVNYPIPGNDDALKSIRFITALISESVQEGRKEFVATQNIKNQKEIKEQAEAPQEGQKSPSEEPASKEQAEAAS